MTYEQFTYWMKGYIAACSHAGVSPKIADITEKLDKATAGQQVTPFKGYSPGIMACGIVKPG